MNRTGIEYLTHTWNPIAMRCTPVSEGCAHCWHLRMCDRMAANPVFPDDVRAAYAGEGPPVLINKRMEEPGRRKKPAVIGVQFMGDLFHNDIHNAWIQQVFTRMKFAPQHTFVVLTKRAKRMYDVLTWFGKPGWGQFQECKNILLGVTAENQRRAYERIPWLRATPAAVRFVSFEPLLGSINATPYLLHQEWETVGSGPDVVGAEAVWVEGCLDWVICGAETGPGARQMPLKAAISLAKQCKEAGVPFFFKQMGPHYPYTPVELSVREWPE